MGCTGGSPRKLAYDCLSRCVNSRLFEVTKVRTRRAFLNGYSNLPMMIVGSFVNNSRVFIPFGSIKSDALRRDERECGCACRSVVLVLRRGVGLAGMRRAIQRF